MGRGNYRLWRSFHGTEFDVGSDVRYEGFSGNFTYVCVPAVASHGGAAGHCLNGGNPEFVRDGQYTGASCQSGDDGNRYLHVYHSWL